MSTQALIRYLNKIGFKTKKGYSMINIYTKQDILIASISHNILYYLRIELLAHSHVDPLMLLALFHALTDYAMTPLNKREEEELFTIAPLSYNIGDRVLVYDHEEKEWFHGYPSEANTQEKYQVEFTINQLIKLGIDTLQFNLFPVNPQEEGEPEWPQDS